MAMIYCRECGKRYSDRARACPKCGYRSFDAERSVAIYLVLLWLFGLFGAHRFYAGKSGSGLAILMMVIIGILFILFTPLIMHIASDESVLSFIGLGMAVFFAACVWVFVDFIFALCNIKHPDRIFAPRKH